METVGTFLLNNNAAKNLLAHKGYFGKVEFDNEAGIFFGEVINLRDVITFQGTSVEELRQAFQDSVEDYLDFCAELNVKPEKPYSGKFIVRTDPELHRILAERARLKGLSMNQYFNMCIRLILAEEPARFE